MPGTDVAAAADIVLGETGELPHVPQLPERGIAAGAVARTAFLLPGLAVDRGPRGWVLTARDQLITRRGRDLLARDLDAVQEVWETAPEVVKVQCVGPWSLAAALELGNGHRAVTDRGAVRELHDSSLQAVEEHAADVADRFQCRTVLQLDEPYLGAVLAGRVPGATDFETIPAVPADVAAATLEDFAADYLWLPGPRPSWEAAGAARTAIVDFAAVAAEANYEGAGMHLEDGYRLGCAVTPSGLREPGRQAREIAGWLDRLGMRREVMATQLDVNPWPVSDTLADAAGNYSRAAKLGDILASGDA